MSKRKQGLTHKVVKRLGKRKILFVNGWTMLRHVDGSWHKINIKDFHKLEQQFREDRTC